MATQYRLRHTRLRGPAAPGPAASQGKAKSGRRKGNGPSCRERELGHASFRDQLPIQTFNFVDVFLMREIFLNPGSCANTEVSPPAFIFREFDDGFDQSID